MAALVVGEKVVDDGCAGAPRHCFHPGHVSFPPNHGFVERQSQLIHEDVFVSYARRRVLEIAGKVEEGGKAEEGVHSPQTLCHLDEHQARAVRNHVAAQKCVLSRGLIRSSDPQSLHALGLMA